MKPDTEQKYYMNTVTGSVDTADGWDDDGQGNLWIVEVIWNDFERAWEEIA